MDVLGLLEGFLFHSFVSFGSLNLGEDDWPLFPSRDLNLGPEVFLRVADDGRDLPQMFVGLNCISWNLVGDAKPCVQSCLDCLVQGCEELQFGAN